MRRAEGGQGTVELNEGREAVRMIERGCDVGNGTDMEGMVTWGR